MVILTHLSTLLLHPNCGQHIAKESPQIHCGGSDEYSLRYRCTLRGPATHDPPRLAPQYPTEDGRHEEIQAGGTPQWHRYYPRQYHTQCPILHCSRSPPCQHCASTNLANESHSPEELQRYKQCLVMPGDIGTLAIHTERTMYV